MIVYVTVLFCIIVIGSAFFYNDRVLKLETSVIDFESIGCCIISVILFMVAGLRYCVGTDYLQYIFNYTYNYRLYDFSFMLQPGNSIIGAITNIIYDDFAIWFLLMSFICVVPIIYVIKKYSIDPLISIVFYILLGCWSGSFNIIKQYAAVSLLLLFGYKYLLEGNFYKWTIACLIASIFHVTAVLLIPFYFLFNHNQKLLAHFILVSFIGIVLFFSYDYAFNAIGFLKGTEMSYSDATRDYFVNSVNPLRIVIKFVPLFLIYYFRNRLDFDDKQLKLLINICMVDAIFSLAAFNSIYMQRFMIYFGVFNVFLFPYIFKCFNFKEKIIGYPVIYTTYFVFWFYDLYKGSTTADFHWIFERGF